MGAAPITNEQQVQITIKTKGRLTRPEEFAAIVLRTNPGGSVVRVKDVARIEMGARSQDRHSRFNGAPTASIGIYQTPGSNSVDVTRRVRETMTTLATRFPNDLAYTVFFDTTVFVTATIDEVIRTLAEAIILVALVVFLFLGKLRTTLIPLVAVPVSIVGTFAVMLVIGYSANTVSLLALVLAIGIVVDDAIVVVENVERVIDEEPELPVPEACKKAMAEITGPILAITLVLLSVFVPVAFILGISGQLFRQFAVAVSVSMLISALNALTLSLALCAVLLKRGQTSRGPMRYVLSWVGSTGSETAMWRWCAGWCAWRSSASRSWPAFWRRRHGCSARRRRAFCRRRTRARSSPPCGFPKAPRSTAPRRWSKRSKTSSRRSRASKACCPWSG